MVEELKSAIQVGEDYPYGPGGDGKHDRDKKGEGYFSPRATGTWHMNARCISIGCLCIVVLVVLDLYSSPGFHPSKQPPPIHTT